MEHLTKQQLILVALLVSFMTSIATGIVTVSLMEQAPDPVTQTINRVVERTIETVVQAPQDQKAAVVTKETIVVRSDDLVVEAVDKVSPHIVRFEKAEGDTVKIIGFGMVVDGGFVVASFPEDQISASTTETYSGRLGTGKKISMVLSSTHATTSISVFSIKGEEKIRTATLGNSDSIKLGQTVVSLGGTTGDVVRSGIVSSLDKSEINQGEDSKKILIAIETDILLGKMPSVLTNLSGEVIGFSLDSSVGKYIPINDIKFIIK